MRTALAKMSIFRLSVMLQRYSILPSNVGDTVDVARSIRPLFWAELSILDVFTPKKKRRIFRCILKACVRVLNNDVGGHAITNANGLRKLLQGPVSSGQSAA